MRESNHAPPDYRSGILPLHQRGQLYYTADDILCLAFRFGIPPMGRGSAMSCHVMQGMYSVSDKSFVATCGNRTTHLPITGRACFHYTNQASYLTYTANDTILQYPIHKLIHYSENINDLLLSWSYPAPYTYLHLGGWIIAVAKHKPYDQSLLSTPWSTLHK